MVSFKKEMEGVQQIKDLSYHKIADVLNSMKIPTETKKGGGMVNLYSKSLKTKVVGISEA